MKKLLLAIALLLQLTPAIAQKIEVEKKTGLIIVDGTPSFYLTSRNRVLFSSDYALENLQHQELAYLKALQQPTYSPASGNSTETYYNMTFSQSGNSCELHGFTSFSVIKSLGRSIAAARLIQNNQISREAERKFVMMYNGVFVQDPADDRRGGRRGDRYYGRDRRNDDGYNGNGNGGRDDDRYRDNQRNNDGRDNRYNNDDDRNDNAGDDRNGRAGNNRDDRNNDNRNNDADGRSNNDRDDRGNAVEDKDDQQDAPRAPLNINIANGKVYDGDELIASYKPLATVAKTETGYTVFDAENKKVATVRHKNASTEDWQITMAADGKKVTIRYRADSPLVKLFKAMAEQGYL